MSKKLVLGFFIICSLHSCQSEVNKEINTYLTDSHSDIVVRNIPEGMRGASGIMVRSNILKKLGISSLENGFDDLQIRIWSSCLGSYDTEQLVILIYKHSKWSAELYNLKFKYNQNYDTLLAINKEGSVRNPKSNWGNVISDLLDLKILELPDYSGLSDYPLSADADGATFEIASKNKYRIYTYHTIGEYKENIPEVKNVDGILRLLQKEFGFRLIK